LLLNLQKNGIIYYGSPIFEKTYNRNPSWAQFQWDEGGKCPGKCLLFIDLSNVKYKIDAITKFDPDINVIIQSLNSSIYYDANDVKILHKSTLFRATPFYCVSVESIAEAAFVIPDISNKNKDNFLYLYPRDTWKNNF